MKTYNSVDMKGRLYSYSLDTIQTEKGEAISGDVVLEVDAEGTLVTLRFFGYPTYSSGKVNRTYNVLEDMLAGNYKTITDDGEEADWIACTGSIDVSYFVARNAGPNEDLARAQKIRGGFINPNKDKKYVNKWKLDFLITSINEVEADEEAKLPRFVRVGGFLVDSYNQRLMEVQFQARSEGAMNYILGIDSEGPYFVSTWGQVAKIARLIVRKNAFGEDETDEYSSTQWVITGMNPEPYEFGDESVMTEDEYAKYMAALDEHKTAQKEKERGESDSGSGQQELAF